MREETPTAYGDRIVGEEKAKERVEANLELFVELVQDETHAVHETVHVRWFTFVVRGAFVRGKCLLEGFKVLHPLDGELVRLNVGFVKHKDEGEFRFVQDAVRCYLY